MISLLTSGFKGGCRRVLFLSMDRLAVYHWQDNKSLWPFLFDVTAEGKRHFNRYLQESPRITTCLLVDMMQEEYRQDSIPHVPGSDRQAIITRNKQRYFRDTPYFHAEIQGRTKEGRRDDIVLYTALANPDLIKPWVKLLMENRVPIAGIYSLPQVTGSLLDHLPGTPQQRLVISMQSISGLRQTCFLNNKLKMSRLLDLQFGNAEIRAAHIRDETETMLRYMHTMCFLDINKPLEICYLADEPINCELQKLTCNTSLLQHHFIDVGRLASQLGIKKKIAAPFCDQLFVYLLLKQKMPNYYATRDELHLYHRQIAGRIMHAASTGLMCAGLLWGSFNYIDGSYYAQRLVTVTQKAEYFNALNKIARRQLPALEMAPVDLKVLSDVAHNLEQKRVNPFNMLQLISKSMDQFPMIQVEQIIWSSIADNEKTQKNGAKSNGSAPKINGKPRIQVATMHGYIRPFDGDYRGALDMIDAFAIELRNSDQILDVTLLSLPMDIGPAASIEGSSAAVPGEAAFSVRVVLGLPDETK